jgi:hypothetical protein
MMYESSIIRHRRWSYLVFRITESVTECYIIDFKTCSMIQCTAFYVRSFEIFYRNINIDETKKIFTDNYYISLTDTEYIDIKR